MVSVLIVEDEVEVLRLFSMVVAHFLPHTQVLTAAGGAEALEILSQESPAILILDMAMPIIGGNEILDYVITQPRLDGTAVLVITAVPHRLREDLRPRVSTVLSKPVSPRDLQRLLHEHLSQSQ